MVKGLERGGEDDEESEGILGKKMNEIVLREKRDDEGFVLHRERVLTQLSYLFIYLFIIIIIERLVEFFCNFILLLLVVFIIIDRQHFLFIHERCLMVHLRQRFFSKTLSKEKHQFLVNINFFLNVIKAVIRRKRCKKVAP
jgi:hypothetical protein